MITYGIDPGEQTGIARYEAGKLVDLSTITPLGAVDMVRTLPQGVLVVMEDSRLQSFIFNRNVTSSAKLKIARDVGRIDAQCKMIETICYARGIVLITLSPRQKGAKLNAKLFKSNTGWDAPSNQHERDAGMVAWPFRNGAR